MSHLYLQSHMACGGGSVAGLIGGNLPWVHQSVFSRASAKRTQRSVLNWQAVTPGGLGFAEVSACKDVDLTHDAGQGKLETGLRQKLLPKILALAVAENPLPSPSVSSETCPPMRRQEARGGAQVLEPKK